MSPQPAPLPIGLLLTLALACGGPATGCQRRATAPVSGVVTLDGRPLELGMVIFTPDAGRGATGAIGPDGRYALSTFGHEDGATLGRHRVAIVAQADRPRDEAGPMKTGAGPSLIPSIYADAARSGLACEVRAGKNIHDFSLTSRSTP